MGSKTRTATPKWPRCSPSKRWPRWTPRSWASSPWTPCTRTKVPSLNKCTQHQKRSPSRATCGHRRQDGVTQRLGAYLKRLAAKLCRKVLRKVVKKVHKYVRRHVTRFCIKLCIKAAGKVYLLGGGFPAAGAVAAAIGAGCKIGCKLGFRALVKFIRHRYLSGAKMDVFVADYVCDSVGSRVKNWLRSKTNPSGASSISISRSVSRTLSRKRRNASVARRFVSITRGTSRSTLGAARSSRAGSRRGSVVACNQQQVF